MNARTTLDAWREQGADRVNLVGFHRIDALERRAAAYDGEVRRLLDARLAGLIEAYARELGGFAVRHAEDTSVSPGTGALSAVIAQLADQAAARADRSGTDGATPSPEFPELGMLEDFRRTWSNVLVESQLRQTLTQAPADAGPLNSARLVHRSISLMRELSPGYLQQFLSYIDTLAWMERLSGDGAVVPDETPRVGGGVKRVREKPRKRKE